MVKVFLAYLFRDSGIDKNNMLILLTPIYTNGAYHIILLLIFFSDQYFLEIIPLQCIKRWHIFYLWIHDMKMTY